MALTVTFSSGVAMLRALGPFTTLSCLMVPCLGLCPHLPDQARQRWNFWTSPSVWSGVSCLPGFITMDNANSSFVSD